MDEDHDRVGTSGSLRRKRNVDVQLEAVLTGLSVRTDQKRHLQQQRYGTYFTLLLSTAYTTWGVAGRETFICCASECLGRRDVIQR